MKGNKKASHMDNKYQAFADLLYASYSGLQTLAFDVGEKSQTLSGLYDGSRILLISGDKENEGLQTGVRKSVGKTGVKTRRSGKRLSACGSS